MMATWVCSYCQGRVKHDETIASRIKGVGIKHARSCLKSPKSILKWRVPVWGGEHCCPFRYRGCLFSHPGCTERVRKHVGSVECCGPAKGDTDAKIYENMSLHSTPAEWGQYVQETYSRDGDSESQVFIKFFYDALCDLDMFPRRTIPPLILKTLQQSLRRGKESL